MSNRPLDRDNMYFNLNDPTNLIAQDLSELKKGGNSVDAQARADIAEANSKIEDLQTLVVNVKAFGAKGDGTTDDTTDIQNAIDSIKTTGGTVSFPPGVYVVTGVKLYSKIHLVGSGTESTVLKLKNGTNKDVVFSASTYSLEGTGSLEGENNFSIQNITIDGNRANNPGAGRGVRLYGYDYTIRSVRIRECGEKGFCSEWGAWGLPAPNGNMEAFISDLKVSNCGTEGIDFAGPHDSLFVNTIVNNCNKNNWGAAGILTRDEGLAVFTNAHVWGVEHDVAYKLEVKTHLSNCQGEGAKTNVVVLANDCSIIGGEYFGFNPGEVGIVLGSADKVVSGTLINTKVTDCQGGVINLINESLGHYTIKAYSTNAYATDTGVIGNLHNTSYMNLINHATNGTQSLKLPTGTTVQTQGSGGWNDGHLVLGNYHLWVDSTGKLRIKSSPPTSDSDGIVVGTQT